MTHHNHQNKPKYLWLIFSITLLLFGLGWYLGLRFGAVRYSNQDLIRVLKAPFKNSAIQDVIIDLRLPRTLAAMLVGGAMAQAGAIIQGVTRNPIADPGLLGINAGAGLALILTYAFIGKVHYSWMLIICLIGSILAAFLVFGIAYQPKKGYNQIRLILAGAMISTLFSAIGQATTLYFNLSNQVIGWQAGGFSQINGQMLMIIAPVILLGMLMAQLLSHQLTILSLNETVAKSLGQRTFRVTLLLLGTVLLLSAASVALVGSVAFIGLIIPHFIRMFVGKNYRRLLPITASTGATFMLWVDLASRTLNPPVETPISAIISIIGLPCFLWLINRGRHL